LRREKPRQVFPRKLRFRRQFLDAKRFTVARQADSPDGFNGVRLLGMVELARPLHEEGKTGDAGIMGVGSAALFGFGDKGIQGRTSRGAFRQRQNGSVQPTQLAAEYDGERAIEVDPGKRPGLRGVFRIEIGTFLWNQCQKSVAGRNPPTPPFPSENPLTGKRALNNHKLTIPPQMVFPEIAGRIYFV